MLLGSNKRGCNELNVYIDNEKVKQVKNIRYLGIEIDDKLLWDSHVKNLSKSLSYKIYTLRKLRKFISFKVLNNIYKLYKSKIVNLCNY